MYKSLANAVQIEAAKANTALEAAKAKLVEELTGPSITNVVFMRNMSEAQASLHIWTKLYLIAERYKGDAALQSKRLVFATNKLRDELVEEYTVQSTDAWVNAAASTDRKAKVEVYAILREFTD